MPLFRPQLKYFLSNTFPGDIATPPYLGLLTSCRSSFLCLLWVLSSPTLRGTGGQSWCSFFLVFPRVPGTFLEIQKTLVDDNHLEK